MEPNTVESVPVKPFTTDRWISLLSATLEKATPEPETLPDLGRNRRDPSGKESAPVNT